MKLLWLDLETTGLSPVRDEVLEVAAFLADFERPFELRPLVDSVAYWERRRGDGMRPEVVEMHTKSGLLVDAALADVTLEDVERELLARLTIEGLEPGEPLVLAGSSVHFDHDFIKTHMPDLAAILHYRHYDVRSVALFAQSLGMPEPPKTEAVHRAAADVRHAVALAQSVDEWFKGRAA